MVKAWINIFKIWEEKHKLEKNNEFIFIYLGYPWDKHMVENICGVGNES